MHPTPSCPGAVEPSRRWAPIEEPRFRTQCTFFLSKHTCRCRWICKLSLLTCQKHVVCTFSCPPLHKPPSSGQSDWPCAIEENYRPWAEGGSDPLNQNRTRQAARSAWVNMGQPQRFITYIYILNFFFWALRSPFWRTCRLFLFLTEGIFLAEASLSSSIA